MSKKKRSASSLNQGNALPRINNTDSNNSQSVISNPLRSQRAATFPMPMSVASLSRQSVSFENSHYNHGAGKSLPIRQSFHELASTGDTSVAESPDSATSGNITQVPFGMQQPHCENFIPELGAMMFPSADPFAYPNQPMIGFENRQPKQEFVGNMLDTSVPNIYLSNSATNVSSPYDNIEGQLFGPLPPYLMQNEPNMDASQINMAMAGVTDHDMRVRSGLTPGVGVDFDEIFAEGNEG